MVIRNMRYLYIFAFVLERVSSTLDCVSPVDSCPCSSEDWGKRASIFKCTGLNYTCMLTFNNTLAEACIPDYPVKPGSPGCPFLQSCYQSIPIIAVESEFKPCPPNKTECPDQHHSGYSLTRLYEFPLCIMKNSTTCSERSIHPFNENKIDHLPIILGSLFGSLFLVFVLVGIFFYMYRRRRRKGIPQGRRKRILGVSLESDPFLRKQTDEDWAFELLSIIRYGDVDELKDMLQQIKESVHTDMSTVINNNRFDGVPLSHAVCRRNTQMVDMLLREGADFEMLNKEKDNPIQDGLFRAEAFVIPLPDIGTKATTDFLKCLLKVKDKYAMDGATFNRFKVIIEKAIEEYKEIPQEIIDMGQGAVSNYRRNIKKGKLPSKYIRCMVVGHYGVGKTTLVRGLLNKSQRNIQSTDGIEVHREMCFIENGKWKIRGYVSCMVMRS